MHPRVMLSTPEANISKMFSIMPGAVSAPQVLATVLQASVRNSEASVESQDQNGSQ